MAIRFIAAAIVLVFFAVTVLDLAFLVQKTPSVAQRLQNWSRSAPLAAAGLAAVIGALLGHFFLWAPLWDK
jgi:uncharacterized integral membrane protein